MLVKPKPLILPKRELYLPRERRKLPRPAPWIWIPKRFAPMMAVAFDNKPAAVNSVNNNSGTLSSNTFTVGATATIAIGFYTCSCTSGNTLATPSSASFNSVAMTLFGHATASDNLSNIYGYALVNPSTGAGLGGSVTYSGGAGAANTVTNDFDVFTFTGSDTSSVANAIPSANVQNNATTSTTVYPSSAFAITTVSGDMAVAGMNTGTTTFSSVSTGTAMNNESGSNVNYNSARNPAVGATTNIQFSGGSAAPCCGVAFDIAQPGSGDVLQASPGKRWM